MRDGREVKMFFVGDRRPEALDALPQAALRSITVATDDDLVSLEREITRSRGNIREFNRGEVAVSEMLTFRIWLGVNDISAPVRFAVATEASKSKMS